MRQDLPDALRSRFRTIFERGESSCYAEVETRARAGIHACATRGGPNPTLEIRDPDFFGYSGSGRWDLDLLDDDPDLEKEPDPNEDPDLFLDLVS